MEEKKELTPPAFKDFVQIGNNFNVVLKESKAGKLYLSIGQKNKDLQGNFVWNNILLFDRATAAKLYEAIEKLGGQLGESSRSDSSTANIKVETI